MKSICTDVSGQDMTIRDCIFNNLSKQYNIYYKVINFKDYGVPSSRPRTLVIGTSRELHYVMPLDLFPTRKNEILLRDCSENINFDKLSIL
jgi:DNA (cytosine-5)-methyltransferase 1